MPLKHFTETFLVVLLGVIIALTGLIVSTLPPLPMGAIPWVIVFVLSVIYPLALTPLFQQRRADNAFRLLHWFPAVMLLVWLAFELIAIYVSPAAGLGAAASYTWGWTMTAVVLGIILLAVFCMKVIRRRLPRIALLAALLVLFLGSAIASETTDAQWETELASVLWGSEWWQQFGSGSFLGTGTGMIASTGSGDKNLEPSDDPSEEAWREQLRIQKQREERIAQRLKEREKAAREGKSSSSVMLDAPSSSSSSSSVSSKTIVAMESSVSSETKSSKSSSSSASMLSGTGQEIRDAGSKPSHLPSSGFDWGMISTMLVAGYATTVHKRAKKRS